MVTISQKNLATEFTESFARPGRLGQGENLLNSLFSVFSACTVQQARVWQKRLLQEV